MLQCLKPISGYCELCFFILEDSEGDDYTEQEDLDYVVQMVFRERTGEEDAFYIAEENYSLPQYSNEIEFEWAEDDEESISKIYIKKLHITLKFSKLVVPKPMITT